MKYKLACAFSLALVMLLTGCAQLLMAGELRYEIVYQEDEKLCKFAVEKINTYVRKRGHYKLQGMREQADLSAFSGIVWNTIPNVYHTYYAEFDINNDGIKEIVVDLVDGDNNSIYIYRKEMFNIESITSIHHFSADVKNMLGDIDLNKQAYNLYKLNEKPNRKYSNYDFSHEFYAIVGSFDIQFIKFEDTFYTLLTGGSDTSYQGQSHLDESIKKWREFIIVGNYIKGNLSQQETLQQEAIEDKCYFERESD